MFQYLRICGFRQNGIRDNNSKEKQRQLAYPTFSTNYAIVGFFYSKQRNVDIYFHLQLTELE
jgi:hypothetical protein